MTFNVTRYFESLLLAIVLTGSSCGTDVDDNYSNSDSGGDDQSDAAADSDDGGANQDGKGGQADGTGGDSFEAYGFSVRIPRYHSLTCQSEMGGTETVEELESDFLCTFAYAGESGHIYLKSKPIGCTILMGAVVNFEIEGAQLALGDSVIDLENAVYNRGGNHVNDSFEFDYQGKHLKYYHSSFGFGWRVCQPMDCIQVFNSSADEDPIEDGCTSERTLPVVCSQIQEDGSFDELIDNFAPCPGDSNTEQPQG